jgi:hypothetical protein
MGVNGEDGQQKWREAASVFKKKQSRTAEREVTEHQRCDELSI